MGDGLLGLDIMYVLSKKHKVWQVIFAGPHRMAACEQKRTNSSSSSSAKLKTNECISSSVFTITGRLSYFLDLQKITDQVMVLQNLNFHKSVNMVVAHASCTNPSKSLQSTRLRTVTMGALYAKPILLDGSGQPLTVWNLGDTFFLA